MPSSVPTTKVSAQAPVIVIAARTSSPAKTTASPNATVAETVAGPPAVALTPSRFFARRLQEACKTYHVNQRRAIQAAVLYEAHRVLNFRKQSKGKQELLETAKVIVRTCTWIPAHLRNSILSRTMTKKLPLNSELAYKRVKENVHYLTKGLIPRILEFGYDANKSHVDNCNAFLQHSYSQKSGKKNSFPNEWMYKVDSQFLTYRLFYLGDSVDPKLPASFYPLQKTQMVAGPLVNASTAPRSPVPVVQNQNQNLAPNQNDTVTRGAGSAVAQRTNPSIAATADAGVATAGNSLMINRPSLPLHRPAVATVEVAARVRPPANRAVEGDAGRSNHYYNNEPNEEDIEGSLRRQGRFVRQRRRSMDPYIDEEGASKKRRVLINEISEHLDVLKHFEGYVPARELHERRKALFQALPMPR